MRAEMRGGSVEEKRRALQGTPDQLSFRRGLVCMIACLLCVFEREALAAQDYAPQLLTCFPSKVP